MTKKPMRNNGKLSHEQIERNLRALAARHGIALPASQEVPAVSVYPGERTIERLAHFGADRLIANNAAYDAVCDRNDAVLAEISVTGIPALPARSRHAPHARPA